jgi:hypothetical protein
MSFFFPQQPLRHEYSMQGKRTVGKSVDHFLPGESFASIIEGRQLMFVSQDRKNLPFSLSQAASYVVFL